MPALPRLSGRSSPLSAASALDGAAVLVGLRYPNLALLDRLDGGRGSGRQHLGDAPLGRSSLSDCPTALPTVAAPLPRSVMHAGASFSLDGNLLVWSHFVFGREPDSITSSIRARVLPFGHIRTLFQSHVPCEMQIDPQVSNGRLVWVKARWPRDVSLAEVPSQQCEGQLQTNVMTRRLTGPVKQVTVDGQSTQPETNGRFIIWTTPAPDPICACSSLHLMDTFRGLLLEPAREIASARILPRAVG